MNHWMIRNTQFHSPIGLGRTDLNRGIALTADVTREGGSARARSSKASARRAVKHSLDPFSRSSFYCGERSCALGRVPTPELTRDRRCAIQEDVHPRKQGRRSSTHPELSPAGQGRPPLREAASVTP